MEAESSCPWTWQPAMGILTSQSRGYMALESSMVPASLAPFLLEPAPHGQAEHAEKRSGVRVPLHTLALYESCCYHIWTETPAALAGVPLLCCPAPFFEQRMCKGSKICPQDRLCPCLSLRPHEPGILGKTVCPIQWRRHW